ncbi:MAG TPA: flagellar motor protein MotB, partial [Saprospiraceae bacterium]|nr:flagellar motor protein MotB [Saprospiraceae bacterium]
MCSRKLLPLVLVLFAVVGLNAQSAKLKYAKKKMDDLSYVEAIEIYNQVLEKEDVAEAKINIAECYRKIGDAQNAEFWYGQVVRLPEAEPVTKLYYGQMLQRNGKCELAREWFNQYIEQVPDDLRGQYLARACDYEQELMSKNAGIFEVKHLDFNSDLDDFGPNY